MKKIPAQRSLTIFLHIETTVIALLGLIIPAEFRILAGVNILVFFCFSLLMMRHHILFDEQQIQFHLGSRSRTCQQGDIQQIFIKKRLLMGCDVIFNFTDFYPEPTWDIDQYKNRALNAGDDILIIPCMAKRDLDQLLECYRGKVQYAAEL